MHNGRAIERIWRGSDPAARLLRSALAPLELAYAGAVALRNVMYRTGVLHSHPTALPSLSVGNLTVGGTGKTPIAAWIAGELRERGARPALVLRGYGDDEPLVHQALNPTVPVFVSADRLAGIERARWSGADVAVLDDAFQHRRARRDADLVLISADRWAEPHRLLPAGAWREPLHAVRRASLVIVTRKAAAVQVAERVARSVAELAADLPVVVAHLAMGELRSAAGDETRPVDMLAGARVLAIAAVGDPWSFVRQLEHTGASIRPRLFADHYPYASADIAALAVEATSCDFVVCTLKDAVKLGPSWPREARPLWYVSQRVRVERGHAELDTLLDRVLQHRSDYSQRPSAAGASGSTNDH